MAFPMQKRILFLALIVIILAGGLVSWQRLSQANQEELQTLPTVEDNQQIYASPTLSEAVDQPQSITLVAQTEGETAFDLLLAEHEVAYKEYDFGVFIESIDGLAGDDTHYWALYFNGEYAKVGADQLELMVGDEVEFRYEELAAAPDME